MRRLTLFLSRLYIHRALIKSLAARELRQRYIGTLGGILWLIIQPLALVATFWLVFSVGFKVGMIEDKPFILYFICGYAPWLAFAESVSGSIGVIKSNNHLVTKVVFPTEILPVVQLCVAFAAHCIVLMIVFLLVLFYGMPLDWHSLQLLYFAGALMVLAIGLSWLVSALAPFLRDVAHIVAVILNILFWLTPIVWPVDILPPTIRSWMYLNPVYYVVEGYRDSVLYGISMWSQPWHTAYFWAICIGMAVLGATVFRRLKPQFPEVI